MQDEKGNQIQGGDTLRLIILGVHDGLQFLLGLDMIYFLREKIIFHFEIAETEEDFP